MKVLITGIAGLIGSHCAEKALTKGYEVFGCDNLSGGDASNIPKGVSWKLADVTDLEEMKDVFKFAKPDYVIHCAAMAAEILSPHIRAHTFEQNVIGSTNIINCCVNHEVKCLAFTSSIAVYGHAQPPFTEETSPSPKDTYGLSKWITEKDLEMARDFFGLNYVVFRPHNVIGTRQNLADLYRNVASIHIRQALNGEAMLIFGDGTQTRAFSSVQYVADVITESLRKPETWNAVYNVGSDDPKTVLELSKMVAEAVGTEHKVKYAEARTEAHHAHSSHKKVREAFPQIKDTVTLEESLMEMVEEARHKPLKKPKKFEDIEIAKNLPESWK